MAVHPHFGRLHQQGRTRTPHRAPEQGRSEVRAGQLRLGMRLVQPQARRSSTSTTTRTTARLLVVIDHAFDLLPALLLIALLAAGSGLFVVTFDYR